MERNLVEKILSANIKKIYAYAVNHVTNEQDRQDLAQEICLLAFKSMCTKEIQKPEHYLWVVAHHCLANYYRKKANRQKINTDKDCEELFAETAYVQTAYAQTAYAETAYAQTASSDTATVPDLLVAKETVELMKNRIAYLSKIRRQIIIQYYYEEQKQAQIAKNLAIPLGTVKWHLNIAKQELKKGIEKMEHTKDIQNFKFNPIVFDGIKMHGLVGTTGSPDNIIRKGLCQNILYVIYKEAKTINEIADILSVSPVFIESEIEFLQNHSVVIKNGTKYRTNILLEERTKENMARESAYLHTVASKIAVPIFDAIKQSAVFTAGATKGTATGELCAVFGENYMMYTLFLYFFTQTVSNYCSTDHEITFDEAADIRSDGGKNILSAVLCNNIVAEHEKPQIGEVLHGPAWNERSYGKASCKLWILNDIVLQSARRELIRYVQDSVMDSLYAHISGKELSVEEKAYLIEHKLAQKEGETIGLRIPVLYETEATEALKAQIEKIRDDVFTDLKEETDRYKKAVFAETPPHLRTQKEFLLQESPELPFYVRQELFSSGKLQPLTAEELETAGELFVVKQK